MRPGLWFGHGTDNALDEAAELVFFARRPAARGCADSLSARADARRSAMHVLALFERRMRERVPAAYLTRRMWFAGHEFYVDERVLVPRSPIAELIEARFEPWIDAERRAPRARSSARGSGCIAIASALRLPDAHGGCRGHFCTMRSRSRPSTSSGMASGACACDALRCVRLRWQGERYDVIVSNPPYVGDVELAGLPEEYLREPRLGCTAASTDSTSCGGFSPAQRIILSPHGILIVEVGNSEDALTEAFPRVPFIWLEFERGGGGVFLLTPTATRTRSSQAQFTSQRLECRATAQLTTHR